mgnify:CR=1 FL=1
MTADLLNDPRIFEPSYHPENIVNRAEEAEEMLKMLSGDETNVQDLFLHGSHGTGKSVVTKQVLQNLEGRHQSCILSCTKYNTHYKVLQGFLERLTGEEVSSGYHASDLLRRLEKRIGAVPTVLVLDDADFLLENDGDDLLYSLSRIDGAENLGIVLITSYRNSLRNTVESRTYSSLQPQKIVFNPYTSKEIYRILSERAREAFTTHSVHRNALTYIASSVANAGFALHWLRVAAANASDTIRESAVKDAYSESVQSYTAEILGNHSLHHQLLHDSLTRLTEDRSKVNTGKVYEKYQERCQEASVEPLSDRRVSDYLKHLEFEGLIEAEYRYGGEKGKTREIRVRKPV